MQISSKMTFYFEKIGQFLFILTDIAYQSVLNKKS